MRIPMTSSPACLQPRRLAQALTLAFGSITLLAQAQTVTSATPGAPALDPVEIVGTTPLPGTGIDRDLVPANVQSLSGARLREQQELNLPSCCAATSPASTSSRPRATPTSSS